MKSLDAGPLTQLPSFRAHGAVSSGIRGPMTLKRQLTCPFNQCQPDATVSYRDRVKAKGNLHSELGNKAENVLKRLCSNVQGHCCCPLHRVDNSLCSFW